MHDLGPIPGRIRKGLAHARLHLKDQLSVEWLAEVANISLRSRQFTAEIGETPACAIERLRCEAALPRIEETGEPLEQIARQVGLDKECMRRSCLRIYGLSPQGLAPP